MEDDETYDEYDDEGNADRGFSVNMGGMQPGMSAGFTVRGLPAFGDIQKETERQGREAAAELGKSYDTYAARLRALRLSPSKTDMAIDALAAFAQPTRSGRFGEAIGNAGAAMAAQRRETRVAELGREEKLAQAGFSRDAEMAKLRQAYGLKGLDLSGRVAVAQAKGLSARPLKITHFKTEFGVIAAVTTPDLKTAYYKASEGGEPTGDPIQPPANMQPIPAPGAAAPGPEAAASGAVPPPPAPPTAADEGKGRALRETWRDEDGFLYQQTLDGPKKIGDPTPEFLAKKAALERTATEESTKTVETRHELLKNAREVKPIVAVINDAARLIQSGMVVTGIGAKKVLIALKAKAALGDEEAKARVVATERFINATSRQIATIIKQFGSGTAISNSDREMAEKIAGSDITVEAESIAWILDLQKRLNDITLKAAMTPAEAREEQTRRKPATPAPAGRKILKWNPETRRAE